LTALLCPNVPKSFSVDCHFSKDEFKLKAQNTKR